MAISTLKELRDEILTIPDGTPVRAFTNKKGEIFLEIGPWVIGRDSIRYRWEIKETTKVVKVRRAIRRVSGRRSET